MLSFADALAEYSASPLPRHGARKRGRGARAPSANRISPREQRFPLPIPKESNPPFSRNEKLAPGEREFIPCFDRLTRLDRSIKIFHGINVIRYVNKRGRLRTYLVQLNDQRIRGAWKVSAQFLAKMENSIVSLFLRRVYVTSKRLVHFIIYYISSPFISYLFQRNLWYVGLDSVKIIYRRIYLYYEVCVECIHDL